MTSTFKLPELSNREMADYAVARARSTAFDAIRTLWEVRRDKGLRQTELAKILDRDEAWVSRNLSGPGNWTLRTLAELAFALRGDVRIAVEAQENIRIRANYDAYAEYFDEDAVRSETSTNEIQAMSDRYGESTETTHQIARFTLRNCK